MNHMVRLELWNLPIAHLARILAQYPNATFASHANVLIDLGVEKKESPGLPVSAVEQAVMWGLDRWSDPLTGVDPELDKLLGAVRTHPIVERAREEFERKYRHNQAVLEEAARQDELRQAELVAFIRGGE